MIPLSEKTLVLVLKIISEPRRSEVISILENRVAENLPGQEAATSFSLERIRFAVLKVAKDDSAHFAKAVTLAYLDWRDLLVAAEFADSITAHQEWAYEKYSV